MIIILYHIFSLDFIILNVLNTRNIIYATSAEMVVIDSVIMLGTSVAFIN